MRAPIVLIWISLLAVPLTARAKDGSEADYQTKMLVPIQMARSAAEAIGCGLRDSSWGAQIAMMDVEAAAVIAHSEWPTESDKAANEADAAITEFRNAVDNGADPTPDQCNALAESGYLDKMDEALNFFRATINTNSQ